MVKFISKDDILPIRNEVLREGQLTSEQCRFPGDDQPESFHLGCFEDENLACIASFHQQNYQDYSGKGYQLRGMATLPAWQGKGLGKNLVHYALHHLQSISADYVWCNAREVAVRFYRAAGFEVISDAFDIPGIGPHYVMYISLL